MTIARAGILSVLLAGLLAATAQGADDPLVQSFRNPPDSAKPWCYWWWLNGAASREGITRDFEQMKKQGIAGALLFDAGQAGPDVPRGPEFMSPAWRELYKHALREAHRLGIALTVNLCSGWNCGGPWVTHEHAAKKLVASRTIVKGPGHVNQTLPRPPAVQDYYRDLVVLAAPASDDPLARAKLTASSQYQTYGPALSEDGDGDSRWVSNGGKPGRGPTPEKPEFLQFDLPEPCLAAGVLLTPYRDCGPQDVEVRCSDDGQAFRPLKRVKLAPRGEQTIAFAATRAKCFRVVFLTSYPYHNANWNVQVAEIAILSREQAAGQQPPARLAWNHRQALDVTRFVDPSGGLAWDVPPGNWKVERIGYTLHGNHIKCVGSGPTGLEIDTMSAAAMDAHFAETGANLIADAGPLAGQTLQQFHIDSWELGQPTWTPRMREEFERRRGYDPLPWLPAVLGQTVDSPAETRRFLQDYRRTAADLVVANYYGRLRELTLKGGLRGIHPESGGPFFTQWIDSLECLGVNEVPMGEFWKRNLEPDGPITHHHNPSLKQAACAMHIYGKRDCQAEAYTSFGDDWIDDPWNMKDIGDAALCEGLTRNVLCFWVHQPRLDARPGFQWAHVGTHFDCGLTWWPLADGWLTYLARCQHLLRQGLFVADFAYLQSAAIPSFLAPRPEQRPARPLGFDYDVLNAEVLLTRASAKDGRLVLPDGMSYRYLVLPHGADAIVTPATRKKLEQLAAAGVKVVDPQQPDSSLDAVVRADGLPPDVEFRHPSPGANFDWIHRRDGPTEIYFLSNQDAQDVRAEVVFRVTGKQPELWDAVTGAVRDLTVWKHDNGRTLVPLEFAPRQSWFIVFRREVSSSDVQRSTEASTAKNSSSSACGLAILAQLSGPWEVAFDPQWFYPNPGAGATVRFERLIDWTQHAEAAIRHYSGIAVYRTSFTLAQPPAGAPLLLDLGVVKNVARVRLNGRDLGTVWTAPWRVEITSAAKAGENRLEIEVANLWPNRLIGDATLPPAQRRTVTNVRTYDTMTSGTYNCPKCDARKKSGQPAELLPSGLLGPVTLRTP